MYFKQLIIIVLLVIQTIYCAENNYEFTTNQFPPNSDTPTLANGHLGFIIYGNSILLNGLYNGERGESHRARIPNYSNIQFNECGPNGIDICQFTLNLRDGIFTTTANYMDNKWNVIQEIYPHRYFDRAIINQITINRNELDTTTDSFSINLSQHIGEPSEDIDIIDNEKITILGVTFNLIHAKTLLVEDKRYQPSPRDVYILEEDLNEILTLDASFNSTQVTYRTVVGFTLDEVRNEMEAILKLSSDELREKHVMEWHELWTDIGITVDGNDELAQTIHSSIFFLASSLPSLNTAQPRNPFYGLAPSGLGRGGIKLSEYQGHSFWDTEMWMHPPLLLLNPKWSEELLHYRVMTAPAAIDNALNTGYSGLRYVCIIE